MVLFALLLFCGFVYYGDTISCYECNSATNLKCWEKVLPEVLKRNCSEHYEGVKSTFCKKIVQDVEYVDFGIIGWFSESRVIRSCGWYENNYKGKCYTRAGPGYRQKICTCTTDYCNGGHQTISGDIVASTVLMVIASKMFGA